MSTWWVAWLELTSLLDQEVLLGSSPSKGEENENTQLVQRFKVALRKNIEQIEEQVKEWETQIFNPELRAKMTASDLKRKSDTVLSMHKVFKPNNY